MVHNAIGTFMTTNKVKENNPRDLGFAYVLAGLIYGLIGIFGALALVVRIMKNFRETKLTQSILILY